MPSITKSKNTIKQKQKQKTSVQTRVFAGVPAMRSCNECGMKYTSTIAADVKRHDIHHLDVTLGPTWSTIKSWSDLTVESVSTDDKIARIDHTSPRAAKVLIQKYMQHVCLELNAECPDYWHVNTHLTNNVADTIEMSYAKIYTAFAYISKRRVVAVVLLERSDRYPDAIKGKIAGVSRMYTNPKFRQKGFIRRLLDSCLQHVIYGTKLKKSDLSWSQPTTLGKKVIESWAEPPYVFYSGQRHS